MKERKKNWNRKKRKLPLLPPQRATFSPFLPPIQRVSNTLSQYQFHTASAWHINFYVSECARAHFQYQTRSPHSYTFFFFLSLRSLSFSRSNDCINTGPFQINVPIWIHGNWHSWNFLFSVYGIKKKKHRNNNDANMVQPPNEVGTCHSTKYRQMMRIYWNEVWWA